MQTNKALLTNLLSIFLIAIGYILPQYGTVVKVVGFFAFSGAITNWLAIYMLFERIPLVYGSGIIPLQFEVFKNSIKKIIMEQFFNEWNLKQFLNANSILGDEKLLTDKIVNSFDCDKVYTGLVEELLTTSLGKILNAFGGAKALASLKEPFIHKLKNMSYEIIEKNIVPYLENEDLTNKIKIRIEEMVDVQLQKLAPDQVKQIVKEMIDRYLGWVVVWGGVFGGFIGFIMEVVFKIN